MSKKLLEYLINRQKELTHLRTEGSNWRDCDYLDGKISMIEEVKHFLRYNGNEEKSKIEMCAEVIERQDKEIERLKNIINALDTALTYHQELQKQSIVNEKDRYAWIKIAAYKEFTKRLKEKTETYIDENLFGERFERKLVSEEMIDNLLKEMVDNE